MNVDEKMKVFEASCHKLLRAETFTLSQTIDTEIESQIKDELKNYEEKEEMTYEKKLEKMEKDYNKQLYALEMQSKKEILMQKQNIKKEIQKQVTNILKDFTNTEEYKIFFMQKLDESFQKLKQKENALVGILEKDNQKFREAILRKYPVSIFIMDDKYIGGCIVENKQEGIYIDNTILNSINEKLEN